MSEINEHVADLVDDYLHALLSPGRAAEVEQHCAVCPTCHAALDDARWRRSLLQSVPPNEASSQLLTTTVQRIGTPEEKLRRRLPRRFFLGSLAALAACALVLIGAHIYYNRLAASPYDLVVLGQRNLLAATTGSLRIRLTDHTRNMALAGVPVVIELRGNGRSAELARFDTDGQGVGQPRFQLPDWPDGDYELAVTAQVADGVEVVSRPVRLLRSWKLMLTSDKPVYQPGQTIHVRTLALRQPDLHPVAEQEAILTLADPKGNVLSKETRRTSRFGITSVDIPLAKEVLEGSYTLACKIGDTESRMQVEVQPYVLPKFKLDVQLDRAFYQAKEKAQITVQADYFFGKPVADATVEIEVRNPPAPMMAQPGVMQSGIAQDITRPLVKRNIGPIPVLRRFSVRTDDKGTAKAEFVIPEGMSSGPDVRLAFFAAVTDKAGQKQTRSVERVVTLQPVRIEVLPENGSLVQGVENIVYLLVTRADGSPVRTRLTIQGPNEDVDTDANGLASCEVTPSGDSVNWTVIARDEEDKEIARRTVRLACGPSGQDFLLRTDRGLYESGQTMKLTVDGSGNEPVFVDVLKGEQTLLSETISLTNGRGVHAIDLPPDLFGTVRLCAYRMDADGVRISKTRVVYIRPASQLTITPKLDQKEYRPGRKAKLDLTLTGADGKPTPGAISLAGVDEAVFYVLAQRPGTETAYYTLEEQLLQPVFSLYPWSPGRQGPDAGRLAQALFASTARSFSQDTGTNISRISSIKQPTEFRDPSSLHSLAAASLPAKEKQIESQKATGAKWLQMSWGILVLGGLLLGYASLWYLLRPLTVILLHGVGLVFLLPLSLLVVVFLFAGQGAKERMAAAGGAMAERATAEMDMAPANMVGQMQNQWGDRGTKGMARGAAADGSKGAAEPPRVREEFPETLLWTPQLVTDDNGHAHLDIDLADSITTWRISASAVAADGRLGATQLPLKVFQPFFVDLNLPVTLTRNDEVSMPVVVYNYLDRPQTVTLKLENAAWFALTGEAEQRVELAPHEVRSLSYRLKATKAGMQELQVSAFGSNLSDALKRQIEVVPDGRRVEQVFNGSLVQPGGATLNVPYNAIEGSPQAFVKIYPSNFSQLVEGLDNIFRMPYGCFEQTSSTTYPNIMALEYLHQTHKSAPEVEAKARHYINLGYQRLITFEVPGGGFDWFGHAPANRTLSAYGLMEFEDMAKGGAVGADMEPLIHRTRSWLLGQRKHDGSWAAEAHALHEDLTRNENAEQAKLATTAYIAWAVFGHGKRDEAEPTREFLLKHAPDSIKNPHVLALMANALLALDGNDSAAGPYLDRLEALKHTEDGGKFVWWQQPTGARTMFYGAGRSGTIETTALATLALLKGKRHPGTARSALAWLVAQKDPHGTWYSTQATVMTLKALLTASEGALGEGERRIVVRLGNVHEEEIVIPADQSEVLKQLDLSSFLHNGRQRLELSEKTKTGANYQVTLRYNVPEAKQAGNEQPLTVRLDYDRTELKVGESVKATATVGSRLKERAAMVMVDLPIPAGFTVAGDDLEALVRNGRIARYQMQADKVLLYLRGLTPKTPLELSYHLRATMAVKIQTPGARVYEYYDPDREGHSFGTRFTVKN